MIEGVDIPVRREFDEDTPPTINANLIHFNGVGDDGHETFVIHRKAKKDDENVGGGLMAFTFCKTARKPYDIFVAGTLILAKTLFRDDVRFSSDGKLKDLEDARKLASKIYGSDIKLVEIKEDGKPCINVEIEAEKVISEEEYKRIVM